jgi:hypothetical protein
MRIAVIGAGWYGLHIALTAKSKGYSVEIFEKASEILTGAGSFNQLRLHRGFHYLRHSITRTQSALGHPRFMSEYPTLSQPIHDNLYLVPRVESQLDFVTAGLILESAGIQLELVPDTTLEGFFGIEGGFKSDERLILPEVAKDYFLAALDGNISTNTEVLPSWLESPHPFVSMFDYVIDATYLGVTDYRDSIYEATYLPELEQISPLPFGALTLIDGDLWSIFPKERTGGGLFSLSHVSGSILFQSERRQAVDDYISMLEESDLRQAREFMRLRIQFHWPDFESHFCFTDGGFVSHKLKSNLGSSGRAAIVERSDNLFRVTAGKIDAIFEVADEILAAIDKDQAKL